VHDKYPKQPSNRLVCYDTIHCIHFLVTPETPFNYETAMSIF